MQKIILVSLLILCSSKLSTIDYATDMPFDDNNKEFELVSQEDSLLFIFINYNSGNTKFHIYENDIEILHGTVYIPTTANEIIRFMKGNTYKIQFELPNKNAGGKIWLNPSYNIIKVDLDKVYEWRQTCDLSDGMETSLTYSIDNAEKNVTFKFEYLDTYIIGSDEKLPNPFEVCHGQDCKANITTYNFEKGESYIINAHVKKINIEGLDRYILPYFKFHANSSILRYNLWIIILLLLIL